MRVVLPVFSFLLLLIDQLIKRWMILNHPSFVFENRGVLFGLIKNQAVSYLLLAIGFLVLIWLVYRIKLSTFNNQLSILLILAGAISNLIDRLSLGHVVDYLHFSNSSHFNLADIYIFIGVLTLVSSYYKTRTN